MSKLGVAYKRLIDLATLAATPADGDFYVVSDVSNANKEKKVSASRIQHIDPTTGAMTIDGDLTLSADLVISGGEINTISYESKTVYFENNVVFNTV